MIKKILNWWRKNKENDVKKEQEFKTSQAEEKSFELYQIKEFNGHVWFTFNDELVCPTSFFKDENNVVDILCQMRKLYVCEVKGLGKQSKKDDKHA